jgi:hypothetical protein
LLLSKINFDKDKALIDFTAAGGKGGEPTRGRLAAPTDSLRSSLTFDAWLV